MFPVRRKHTSLETTSTSLNDPNVISNNNNDMATTNFIPSLKSISQTDTPSILNSNDQSLTHQSDSLSIDELQFLVKSSKNYISNSLRQASTIKDEINNGNLESKTMLHSINNAITHCQSDIITLTRTRTYVLSNTVYLNKHHKLVRNLNADSKTIIDNITNTILLC